MNHFKVYQLDHFAICNSVSVFTRLSWSSTQYLRWDVEVEKPRNDESKHHASEKKI